MKNEFTAPSERSLAYHSWGTGNVYVLLRNSMGPGGTMGPRPQFSRESYVSERRIFFSRGGGRSEWVTQQLSGTWSGTAAELFGKRPWRESERASERTDGRTDDDGRQKESRWHWRGPGFGAMQSCALEINWCRWRPQPWQRQLGVTSYLSSTPIRI